MIPLAKSGHAAGPCSAQTFQAGLLARIQLPATPSRFNPVACCRDIILTALGTQRIRTAFPILPALYAAGHLKLRMICETGTLVKRFRCAACASRCLARGAGGGQGGVRGGGARCRSSGQKSTPGRRQFLTHGRRCFRRSRGGKHNAMGLTGYSPKPAAHESNQIKKTRC